MPTIRNFIAARIAEEEELAHQAIDGRPAGYPWGLRDGADRDHIARWNPWRVLSGCVARRLILAVHRDVGPGVDRLAGPDHEVKAHVCSTCGQQEKYAVEWPCFTLRVLAVEWADHPDYRCAWRPQPLASRVGRI
jgi:hypothetical protein